MVKLVAQNEEFAETRLTDQEMGIFAGQWKDLWMPDWSFERRFVQDHWDKVVNAVQCAKNALDELRFGGFNCGNSEIGLTPIRPGQVGLVDTAPSEADNVWKWKHDTKKEAQGVGFEYWIHSPAVATTAFTLNEDEFIYPMYIVEENCSPKIQTVKMDIGRTNILWYDVRAARLRDYQTGINLIPLPTTYWLPEMDILVSLGFKYAGTTEPRLGGFCIAKGSFLNATSYNDSTNTVVPVVTTST